jgi:hypothetical protein
MESPYAIYVPVEPVVAVAELALKVKLGGPLAASENVWFGDVVNKPLPFCEVTSKSYVVPGMRPVKVTEWLFTRLVLRGELDP